MIEQSFILIALNNFEKSEIPVILEEVSSCIMFGFDAFKINIEKENKGSFEVIKNELPEFKKNDYRYEVINDKLHLIVKSKI
jgi:hypothetical protein